jgi:predicted small metal-binding protein
MSGYKANLEKVCGCGQWVSGETSNEVVDKTKTHAKQAHGLNEVPNDLAKKLMAAIQPA